MTPAARLQAAAEIIDRIEGGIPAEKALTNWARNSRYAGSKDRRAVRDHVFDCLRMWRSTAALGGAETGRGRVLGLLRSADIDPDTMFTGQGHAPGPLSDDEQAGGRDADGYAAWDLPDWLGQRFSDGLGEKAESTAMSLRHRAEVYLRVNTLKADLATAQAELSAEGILTEAHALSPTALKVTEGARQVARSQAYLTGLVELQDAASQSVVDMLPLQAGMRVLDYCAGGGGKTLAMAARMDGGPVTAHDANVGRMSDLPARAERAAAKVDIVDNPTGQFDLVLCDVPCSGSGAWRRSPEGKWRFGPEDLEALIGLQSEIINNAKSLVSPGGFLAYATCSVLPAENTDQSARFLQANSGWEQQVERQFLPEDGGDGFYVTFFKRK